MFVLLKLEAFDECRIEGVRGLLRCKAHPDPTASGEEAVTPMHLAAESSLLEICHKFWSVKHLAILTLHFSMGIGT